MGFTPEELAAIPITPAGLRKIANKPCGGERSYVLRKAADELERLTAEVKRLKKELENV